ncbi:XkdQ/YqbQ family protein [Vallitalea sp.]|jgi:hypothetical protein|uniref:XkdQ/YqbQ family protein n=1 Tax=Vallitalea sp. TaxID=1882829 RepID=UPI0025E11294|nr:hypothetical protein [Vallitalea sp.]MCT4686088.1 hypothetical protein [Vallitalea sp.]
MKTEIFIDDRQCNVYEVPHGKINLKRARSGRASSLEFEYYGGDIFSEQIEIKNGNVVLLKIDDIKVFYGYVFKVAKDKITCYDQIRYLKYKDTKVFINKTLSQIVKTIATENNLKTGAIVNTQYSIPSQVNDNKEYLDMIMKGIETTLLATGHLYFIQDNVGKLELLDIAETKLDFVIDGDGLLTDYELSANIDSDTYNRIKLARDNKKTGKREVYIFQDSNNISKWGKLQYYEVVDEKTNPAQINQKGEALLQLKNREKKTFKIKNAIGDIRCRSGYSVYIYIPEENINGWYLINTDTHKFDGNSHTMDLELVVK